MKKKSPEYEESKNLLKTLVDFAWNKYHKQHEQFDRLDQKAATFAGFIGVILTLIASFSQSILKLSIYNGDCILFQILVLKILLIAIIILLGLAFYFSILSLRVRDVADAPTITSLLEYHQKKLISISDINKRHKQLMVGIIKSLSRSEISFKNSIVKKSNTIKKVSWLLIITLFLGIIEILILFIHLKIFSN